MITHLLQLVVRGIVDPEKIDDRPPKMVAAANLFQFPLLASQARCKARSYLLMSSIINHMHAGLIGIYASDLLSRNNDMPLRVAEAEVGRRRPRR